MIVLTQLQPSSRAAMQLSSRAVKQSCSHAAQSQIGFQHLKKRISALFILVQAHFRETQHFLNLMTLILL